MWFIALVLAALHVLAMAVPGSAHNDTTWSRLEGERNACRVRALASPEFQACQHPDNQTKQDDCMATLCDVQDNE